MYCEKCGAQIPEGTDQCPKCAQTHAKWAGEVFHFHFESGMSSRSVSEIDHTVSFQSDEMAITMQKSLTVFRRKSKPAVTQIVKYRDIKNIQSKAGLAPAELHPIC